MTRHTHKTAFLFPGQGSQSVGMGKLLVQFEPEAEAVFSEADRILGYSLSDLCWNGPEEQLNETLNTQPALLAHSIAVLRTIEHKCPDLKPSYAAGHSMGEITALVAAGALSFEDGLRLVRRRGEAMQHAGEIHPGGMAAVLGMSIPEVESICAEASAQTPGVVGVANDNCPGQIVISGHEDALNIAAELLAERGARKVVRLAVSIAAHSPLMVPAQDRFNQALGETTFHPTGFPVIGNGNAIPITSVKEILDDLSAQLTVRVRWTESIRYLIEQGVGRFIEIGSGSVLTGLLRRIDRDVTGISIDSPETFPLLMEESPDP
jgi:[acyl-carrier-protein] S-malonyltransferase